MSSLAVLIVVTSLLFIVMVGSYVLVVRKYYWWGRGMTLADFESRHVLFTEPDGSIYIGKMVQEILRGK